MIKLRIADLNVIKLTFFAQRKGVFMRRNIVDRICLMVVFLMGVGFCLPTFAQKGVVSGELRQWHKVTLTIEGPEADEKGTPNPFMDYRMQVQFRHAKTGLTYNVPGYFAADGDAANSSATSGNKWRAHLSPDHVGEWAYEVSFHAGPKVAVSDDMKSGKPVVGVHGMKGSFDIAETDKTGRDFRGKGLLRYVGKHHLQFAGTGEYFLKAGVDAPENFLGYEDFDGEFKHDGVKDNLIKNWGPHVKDWKPGDPTWQGGKGKGIIGAVNYLAGQKLNVFSFLTMNIEGDDRNVFPYLDYKERVRIDCSRMDQWEIVFEHGTRNGMYLHFKTQEAENVNLLDKGSLGDQRKLYYRELIARFGHHLALNWNLGEEVGLGHKVSTQKKKDWANYFAEHDPYKHHIVIHNGNNHYDLLGDASALTGFSLQTNRADFSNVHGATLNYLRRSVAAGKPWVVACDEPGDASHSLITDAEDPTRNNARRNALWGNIMAGGAGVEWYFGYKHPHSDLTCQDYRVREKMWKQSSIALQFFADHEVPFWNMNNANGLISEKQGYCLIEKGKHYLVYLKKAGTTTLDLAGVNGVYQVLWFNPRVGGDLLAGSVQVVRGGGKVGIGMPPSELGEDWLAVIRPADPDRDYAPGVSAGRDQVVMLPREGNVVTVELNGIVTDDGKPSGVVTGKWEKVKGDGQVAIENINAAKTKVKLTGVGAYALRLTGSDGKQQSSATVKIEVKPFEAIVRKHLSAEDHAYVEGERVYKNEHVKVEGTRRVGFVKFNVKGLPDGVKDVRLQLVGGVDTGSGLLQVFEGAHSDWQGGASQFRQLPGKKKLIHKQEVNVSEGQLVSVPVKQVIKGDGVYTFVITLQGGDDIWFKSGGGNDGPRLLFVFDDEAGGQAGFGVGGVVLSALTDFEFVTSGSLVPGYKDSVRKAMAIDAAEHKNKFAGAEAGFTGKPGKYDVILTTLTETDGESTYRVMVNGQKIGEVRNPPTGKDYQAVTHRFKGVELLPDTRIRVEFNTASNRKIPEGDGFAFSRGRWTSVRFVPVGSKVKPQVPPKPAKPKPAAIKYEHNYDVSKAKKIHRQVNGIVVVEAEDYDWVDHQHHRKWYLTSKAVSPGVKPDPDPNHAEGAGGGAYLEILPDTRVTHADPLVHGVSFSNTPGECSVLYYPVEFKEAGRYYVWVRMCCTGSEDNGLHVGVDGKWPASGARLQFTGKHGQWQWDSRQRTEQVHTGVLGKIWLDIDKPGLHTIMFSMREDGFEFDRFMLTKQPNAMKSKNSEMGPAVTK